MGETPQKIVSTETDNQDSSAGSHPSNTPANDSNRNPENSADNTAASSSTPAEPAAPVTRQLSVSELTISNETGTFIFDQSNSGIKSITLRDFRVEKDPESAPVNLVDQQFFIQGTTSSRQLKGYKGYSAERQGNTIRFWKNIGAWEITQSFSIPQKGYSADIYVTWKNISPNQADLNSSVLMHELINIEQKERGGMFPGMPTGRPTILNYFGQDDPDRIDTKSYCEDEGFESATKAANSVIHFYGFDKQYFQKVLIPQTTNLDLSIQRNAAVTPEGCPVSAVVSQSQGQVNPGQSVTMKFKAWFGPKELEPMKAYVPTLIESVDLGWFGFLAKPLFAATKYAESITGNWGWAIILITIALKLVFFPLNQQAAISMNKMKKLQPEMTKIREKHKDDKATQQQEIMKFMSVNKINPMKGCLPILPQIPVFFSFYRVLSTSIELRHAPFFSWIQDLSAADPYYITPLLLGVAMFAQQKLTPTSGMEPAQAKMMLMMPVVFTVMMLSLPSGMVLYMLVNTIISVAQQQWLNRRLA